MHGNRDIVAEGMVVQHIDAEEENDIDQPASEWNLVRSDEERRSSLVELGEVAGGSHKDELNKSQEGPAGGLNLDDCFEGEDITAALFTQDTKSAPILFLDPSPAQLTVRTPPKIRLSIAPIASHCGMVSMKMRPMRAMALE